ncbi:MAG: hypothetical protein LCH74_20195 [Proteobacteria bacterium]|nr:hypothetical protein [Pseudomonadota bacterium]
MASSPFAGYEGYEAPTYKRPDSGAPSTLSETYRAARDLQDADNTDYQDRLYDEAFGSTLEAVNAVRRQEGLPLFLPPSYGKISRNQTVGSAAPMNAYAAMGLFDDGSRDQVGDALVAEVARIRQGRPGFMSDLPGSREQILAPYLARDQAKRGRARGVLDRSEGIGGTAANLAGGVTKAMEDPWNIITLPVGGGGKTILGIAARSALANGLVEVLSQPVVADNRELLGEELTLGESVARAGFAVTGGFVLGGLIASAGKYGGRAFDALTPIEKKLARALEAAEIKAPTQLERQVISDILGTLDDGELVALSRQMGAQGDPNVAAATTAIERQSEIDAGNPYIAGSGDTYADRLSLALEDVLRSTEIPDYAAAASRAIGEPVRTVDSVGGSSSGLSGPGGPVDPEALKAAIRGPESGGDDGAVNRMGSTASGRYQFVEGTFKGYYRKVYGGGAAAADAAWKNQRFDVAVQERLMDALIADNAAALGRMGVQTTTGNMYVMHVLGSGDGPKLLRARPDTPVSEILSADVIRGNPTYFGGNKSASEAIAAMHRVVGGRSGSVPAGRGGMGADADGIGDAALLRDEAMRLRQEAMNMPDGDGQLGMIFSRRFDPAEIGVDAAAMQFKRGADGAGVTDALRGVDRWDAEKAGRVTLWEDDKGRLIVADGHQRVALAKRTGGASIDATVLRSADGWDAESVRVWTALKNVVEGSADVADAARFMRGLSPKEIADFLPPQSAIARDADGLIRLGDDAFEVATELVDPGQASIVGRLAADPGEQRALIDLLIELQPATRGEAEKVIKRAIKGGFAEDGSIKNVAAIRTEMAKSRADAVDGGDAGRRGRPSESVETLGGGRAVEGYSREPDGLDGAWPPRAEIGDRGFAPLDPEVGRMFDTAASEGQKLQGDSLAHDARAQLRDAADEAEQPSFLVDLGDGVPVERTIAELLDEFDADDAALKAAAACL